MFADYHVHTEFSDDSVYPMEDVIRDAVEMGMGEICITDHVDYGVKKDWDQGEISYRNGEPLANVNYPGYMEKIRQMKETWGDKIRIRTGMEFGVQRHTIPEFEKLFGEYVPAYNALIIFTDPETGEEICRYELNHDADNVFSRDFFNEANWEVLDGAEFAAGEWKTGNGEPYRQWTFTVTDEYIK